jgi:hypothetical protein
MFIDYIVWAIFPIHAHMYEKSLTFNLTLVLYIEELRN